ncbi:MAG: hypothetical protein Ct9H300mP3_06780 [Gammaproteobacteria bacterium]|nr:MAG: hypothetical protein Ct9H300mP3_06780 [Gammaproteobacteria bacterium]
MAQRHPQKGVMYNHEGFVSGMLKTGTAWGLLPIAPEELENTAGFDLDIVPGLVKTLEEFLMV